LSKRAARSGKRYGLKAADEVRAIAGKPFSIGASLGLYTEIVNSLKVPQLGRDRKPISSFFSTPWGECKKMLLILRLTASIILLSGDAISFLIPLRG
jgi:hypothetical protein